MYLGMLVVAGIAEDEQEELQHGIFKSKEVVCWEGKKQEKSRSVESTIKLLVNIAPLIEHLPLIMSVLNSASLIIKNPH